MNSQPSPERSASPAHTTPGDATQFEPTQVFTADALASVSHSPLVLPLSPPAIVGYSGFTEIACGGMGRVWQAWDEVLQREVAIKVLLPGADRERFLVEARITGQLSHPAIPPVYALGQLPDGTPYLVMKLIRGQTLAQALAHRTHPLQDLGRWLDILVEVARAVGFAHAHGIVHRDLKPGNIMIGPFDEVQVMDWGVAKAIPMTVAESSAVDGTSVSNQTAERADNQLKTLAGQVLGTPAYMAPEQARGEPADPRADVFALGGILTFILTGASVFSGQSALTTLTRAATGDTDEVLARLRSCGADAELVQLACDCLALEPSHRPPNGLAVAERLAAYRYTVEQRLRRIEAEQAAAAIREAERQRRRRLMGYVAVSIVGVVVVALCSILMALVKAQQAASAEHRARLEADENHHRAEQAAAEARAAQQWAEQAAAEARAAQQWAESQQRQAEQARYQVEAQARQIQRREAETRALLEFLERHILAASRPEVAGDGRGTNITLRQTLDFALPYLDTAFPDHPLVEARLRATLGQTYLYLGAPHTAEPLLRTAHALYACLHGPHDLQTLRCLNLLAVALSRQGSHRQAYELLEPLYRYLVERYGPNDFASLGAAVNLAVQYNHLGRYDEALSLQRDLRARQLRVLGPDHPLTLLNLQNLVQTLRNLGRLREAHTLLEELAFRRERILGPLHPDTLSAKTEVADNFVELEQPAQALTLYKELLPLFAQHYGSGHQDTLWIRYKIAYAHFQIHQYAEALDQLRECVELMSQHLGREHRLTLMACRLLADVYTRLRRYEDALAVQESLLASYRRIHGREHRDTLQLLGELALNYESAGRIERAFSTYEEAIALRSRRLQVAPHDLANRVALGGLLCNRGHLLCQQARPADSLDDYRRAIELLAAVGRDTPQYHQARLFLRNCHWGRAIAYEMLHRYGAADADWHAALELCPSQSLSVVDQQRQQWYSRRQYPLAPPPRSLLKDVR